MLDKKDVDLDLVIKLIGMEYNVPMSKQIQTVMKLYCH